jgi:dTDP-3-amino-2,3,6-trideoxy-4-keto-D-glucose/dTDP-3-amino-3,4,6-trideoxy-alpha-D-glucose/dTDP-2,6-dideoxy-D-kanosamine transaminase
MNDLGRGFREQREAIQDALLSVASSGWYIHGQQHAAFEEEFADFIGVHHCVGVANGTDALELALRAVDESTERPFVLTAANAGGYASAAARAAGLTPRYADVDEASLCLSATTVAPMLDENVRAVVVTHLYGRLAPVEGLSILCRDRGVPLIEDCAQAVGAARNGRRAGSFGTMGTFSFYPTKNLGALGDAGCVVTDDASMARRLRSLRQYGWSEKYVVSERGGRNSRLDEIQASVLRLRLPHVEQWNQQRRAIIRRYREAAAGSPLTVLDVGTDHAAHLAVGITDNREEVRSALSAAGVGTDVHYPVADHRQVAGCVPSTPGLPVTERAAEQVLSLPCFPQMTEAEVEKVCIELSNL